MPNPTFSVITVTYNAEATLERSLRSVLSQTYPHVEYILVDGASKDGTLGLIDRYRDGLPGQTSLPEERQTASHRIDHVISEPDKGLYDAMNKGIQAATGDYLCFLNAGDSFHSAETLANIARVMVSASSEVIYGETQLVDQDGKDLGPRRLRAPERLTWKSFRLGMLVCHQAFMVSRQMALEHPYDLTYRFSADQDWCIRIMHDAQELHPDLPVEEVLFNTHLILIDYLNEGMSTRNRKASLKERFAIYRKHYGLLQTLVSHAWFVLRAVLRPDKA